MEKNRLIADITPGEILAEEFLKPMGIANTGWCWTLACRRAALMRL